MTLSRFEADMVSESTLLAQILPNIQSECPSSLPLCNGGPYLTIRLAEPVAAEVPTRSKSIELRLLTQSNNWNNGRKVLTVNPDEFVMRVN
jgi:hypothetical protein